MKKDDIDDTLKLLLQEQNIPVLILDTRWHTLFPPETKPNVISQLEEEVGNLLKEQGKLVNEIKDLKRAKKKLMDGVIANMEDTSNKKVRKSKNLILEMNERIEKNTQRIMDLPYLIKEVNQQLLVAGIKICYERLNGRKEELDELENEINSMREVLKTKSAYKIQMEEERDLIYSTMHDMLGLKIIEIFDKEG